MSRVKIKQYHKFMGRLLKRYRKKYDINQTDLADLLFITTQQISDCERGLAGISLKHHRRLAGMFKISVFTVREAYLKDRRVEYNLNLPQKEIAPNVVDRLHYKDELSDDWVTQVEEIKGLR